MSFDMVTLDEHVFMEQPLEYVSQLKSTKLYLFRCASHGL